ncbi:MAG TPA: hypothetical protein DIW23_07290, partial [Anaerolineae bacterium]|nr:hypothetical protein [Anaerolineae bacterium]
MRKFIFIILFIIILLGGINIEHWVVIAPELFGRSDAFLIAGNGLVIVDYGTFLMLTKNDQCI